MLSHRDDGGAQAKPVSCPKCDSDNVELVFSEFFAKTIRKS